MTRVCRGGSWWVCVCVCVCVLRWQLACVCQCGSCCVPRWQLVCVGRGGSWCVCAACVPRWQLVCVRVCRGGNLCVCRGGSWRRSVCHGGKTWYVQSRKKILLGDILPQSKKCSNFSIRKLSRQVRSGISLEYFQRSIFDNWKLFLSTIVQSRNYHR